MRLQHRSRTDCLLAPIPRRQPSAPPRPLLPFSQETKSEIVVPVFGRNYHNEPEAAADAPRKLIAVLDIDGDAVGAFDEEDKAALEGLLARLF